LVNRRRFDTLPAVKFIGDRLLRKEDPRLVQGHGRYVGDIALPGMLHAAIVRTAC
jgi:carbon-monoxide dehydrogenase large subunit